MLSKALALPRRTVKPRRHGVTLMIDTGLSNGCLKSILHDYHVYIDFAKLALGTAYITPHLAAKLELYAQYDITVFPGGTLFEKFYQQNKLDDYIVLLEEMGLKWMEVSSGTVPIPTGKILSVIDKLATRFHVIAEVGSKNPGCEACPEKWDAEVSALLHTACRYITLEARTSGTVGLYRDDGSLRRDLFERIIAHVDPAQLIFEAPTAKNQMQLISLLGANVNLGNIRAEDILVLETQRLGLRSETFHVSG